MDSYDPSLGWQGLFAVAGVGVLVLALGMLFQILQIVISILYRKRLENRDLTGDPWDGRTLEWSTSSPPAFYNFANTPVVHDRDAFWDMKYGKAAKHAEPPTRETIMLPNNSGTGAIIGGLAFLFGFAIVWHIWWLVIVAFLAIIVAIIARTSDEYIEHEVPMAAVTKLEAQRRAV